MESFILFLSIFLGWNARAGELSPQANRDLQFSASCSSSEPPISLSFVGDILIHKALYRDVVAGSQHFSQIWKKTEGLIQKADFSIGNLEGPAALGLDASGRDHGDVGFIYDGQIYSGTNFRFNYHPRILWDLKNSGYDALTLANNHVLDRGSMGIDKTLVAAQNAQIPLVGVRHSQEHNGELHQIFEIKDFHIAIVSCTEMTNGIVDRKEQILYCYKDAGRIEALIRELSSRSEVDAVILFPHWGVEYSSVPEARQRVWARRMLEAGAMVLLGSHPHVLQEWEKYVTQDGRETLILYSLGNFVAGQAGLSRKTGLVAYVGLSKNASAKARIVGVAYTPTYRTGSEIFPVERNTSKDISQHIAGFYGLKAWLDPKGDLESVLCRK